MKKPKPKKPYQEMNANELAEATREFDAEFVINQTTPLSPADRKLWARLKRKQGRPKLGAGTKVVAVTVEKTLLAKADKLAKKLKTSRAQLIARGLRRILEEEAA